MPHVHSDHGQTRRYILTPLIHLFAISATLSPLVLAKQATLHYLRMPATKNSIRATRTGTDFAYRVIIMREIPFEVMKGKCGMKGPPHGLVHVLPPIIKDFPIDGQNLLWSVIKNPTKGSERPPKRPILLDEYFGEEGPGKLPRLIPSP
ncbi:hypothetical protein K438DRAFT_1080488 [Mycena galopus ATCC 62051]|nr:hypothetical protein K438DRAFT_1080488 [Mycena galopus ATCC 62051]